MTASNENEGTRDLREQRELWVQELSTCDDPFIRGFVLGFLHESGDNEVVVDIAKEANRIRGEDA